ncbi:formyltetrahydrofolate deformylase [Staphylococcus pseudoxylosus]|uniref:formyltetrahydrofolate deformylase n=1 Tax=Staphylococcus pseudoxylosus TaxID=2282419 RepID=UPI00298FA1C1|nr:formyltetrahydrofolate deformylase [Staphylococcus pseudoxylosus]MDW8798410.1 formyltetrahydrofolate deformylase [Staphylococcus pseudoxylosus]MEB6036182.1 formyltetrahydrofolate deformylase [Staphylococcus pseudoxylosus]MEB6045475.1 formyltetrahydrofolate deformylase [Staphylococcus pseudoxylosus]MEB7762746.1 formyltetrahydrofolate deformylase [Staphylococcus pseudoxylosus]MEB8008353.1 formyltetrahydrofolate deformylase [Staphylococcus pseudoxylosus]
MEDKYILLATCNDKVGITSLITNIIAEHGSNILHLDHFTEYDHVQDTEGKLFLRFEFEKVTQLKEALENTLSQNDINFDIFDTRDKTKIALFVSKEDHAFNEVLLRVQRKEIPAEITCVVSNHENNRHFAESFNIPFYYVPSNNDKAVVEQNILDICAKHEVELIVLAKYMQILTDNFVSHYPNQIINIHHSFLPSFIGANPYKQAWERGVKLVGATSHYVTSDLDEGPIIDQDVTRINHRYNVQDLRKIGRHVESSVLAQAVEYHVQHKVIVNDGNKTIVFN